MNSLSRRVDQIKKRLESEGKGRRYPDIWDESFVPRWSELGVWALGYSDDRPDFWPPDDGAGVESREELRETFQDLLDLRRRHIEVGVQMGLCMAGGNETAEPGIERVKEWLRSIP